MDAPVSHSRDSTAATVGQALPHDSAVLHVTGQAAYTDDLPEPRDLLHLAVGMSEKAHARIRNIDLEAVLRAQGVVDTLVASDIPGDNNFGPIVADDPILVEEIAEYAGHPLFAVAATTVDLARKAVQLAKVDYEALDAIIDAADEIGRAHV